MNATRLRMALAGAGLALALVAVPGTAAAAGSHEPGEIVVGIRGGGSEVVDLPEGVSVAAAAEALRRDPAVRFAEPNWVATTSLEALDQGSSGVPGGWRDDQWNLLGRPGGIRVQPAWDKLIRAGAGGGAGAVVAVVDTGVALGSGPDVNQIAPDFLPGQFVDGTDIVDGDSRPWDENGHGTHIAGTIAEQVTVGKPSVPPDYEAGIAYGAQLMPVRVLAADGSGSSTDVAEGILWAANNGADIINLSLQFDPAVTSCVQVPTVCAAVRKANRIGALVIAASGNAVDGAGGNRALFPGAAPGVLAVGATTEHGCLAGYSYFNRRTDLLAPGGGEPRPAASRPECLGDARPILQLTYACFPACVGDNARFAIRPDLGTSMSAAHASAVAALVVASGAAGPNPDPARLATRLQCTARPGGTPRRFYGPGLLDATRAIAPGRHCDRP